MFGLSKLADQVKQWILKGTCAFFRVHLQRLARCRRKWQSGGKLFCNFQRFNLAHLGQYAAVILSLTFCY